MVVPIIIVVLSCILLSCSYYIIQYLGGINFYELVYFWVNDKTGPGNGTVILDGLKSIWWFLLIVLLLFIIPLYIKKLKFNKIIYSIALLVISIIVVIRITKIDEYLINKIKKTNIYEEYYVNPSNVNINFNKKNNLILIYMESMEMSLVSNINGGAFKVSRIPELETIALDNTNFSNTDKLGGAYNLEINGFTMASLVSTNSGTPLDVGLFKSYKNRDYMSNTKTLGDILKENGYNLEIMQGSDIKFAGTDKYVKEHGDYTVFDYNTAKEKKLISKDYLEWWGFEDSKLFEYAKDELNTLSSKEEPFMLTLFTMNTHFKDGYQTENCEQKFKDKMSNSYYCSNKEINNFIEYIKEQPYYENTTIVLLGDHTTMQNMYYKDYSNYQRTIYNAFINSVVFDSNTKNRLFSSFDLYPTILTSIGANIEGNKLGFGVNLYSGEKTVIETIGYEEFNEELLKTKK